jgi:uncharacterized protein YecA (UPF0149 family)
MNKINKEYTMNSDENKKQEMVVEKPATREHVHGPNCNHGHQQALLPQTRAQPKIGRNDPCVCGSLKKYKKCCGN